MDLKIAVIAYTAHDFKEFVKETGAPPEAKEVFHFINKKEDAAGA